MSEPLSSTEIEDVLSSIRRLVSDDLRPLQRPSAANAVPPVADKLILTPALRVVQPDAPLPQPVTAPYRLHLGLPAQTPSGPDQVVASSVVASVGAAVDAQSLEWEAETGDAAPFAAAPAPQDDWQSDDAEDAAFVTHDVAPKAADEVLSATGQGDDTALQSPDALAPMPGWAQQDSDFTTDLSGDLTGDDADARAVSHGTIEPDPQWADAAEASVIASLAADLHPDDPDSDGPSASYADDSAIFDEEILRELVRDILREELAGRMGERITRNIRKLVRAEIARSFATQEFE